MLKQNINGSFIVIFFWNSTNNNYVLAIRNQTLVIEVGILFFDTET